MSNRIYFLLNLYEFLIIHSKRYYIYEQRRIFFVIFAYVSNIVIFTIDILIFIFIFLDLFLITTLPIILILIFRFIFILILRVIFIYIFIIILHVQVFIVNLHLLTHSSAVYTALINALVFIIIFY